MKFIIATQEFNALITKCLNVVGLKPTVPILANFLIEASHDELTISATDATVGVKCFTEAKILQEGATTLPAKKLAQLVRELTALTLEVSCNSHEVTEIIAGSSRFKLHGMSKEEYPVLPTPINAMQFTLPQDVLKDMFFRSSFAVSREDNRYVLTGVQMHLLGNQAVFTGTDGKRLARAYAPLTFDQELQGNYIFPLKAVEEIQKNLGDEGNALIYLKPDKLAIECNNTTIITKLLQGDYPDVKRVIPEKTEIGIPLHREELMQLLRQVSLFTTDTHHSVRFTFLPGELRLTANTLEIGEGRVSMPVNYQRERLDIAFNPGFFLDILRHCKKEIVMIWLTDSYNPGILTDGEEVFNRLHDASPLFVLMPMRLNEE